MLCLAAHPDDLEVYMGGALLGMSRAGWQVQVWIATRGEKGTFQPAAGTRVEEARAALGSLGISCVLGDLEDGNLAGELRLDRILLDLVTAADPGLLFAPHPSDSHLDHAALGAAVGEALLRRPASSKAALWHWLDAAPGIEPSHFLDLGSSLAEKLALIGYHKSQIPGETGPRGHLPDGRDILERAEHRDRGYGRAQGRAYLEPFLAPEARRSEAPCILESVQDFKSNLGTGNRE